MKKTCYFVTMLFYVFLTQLANATYDTYSFHIHINDPVEMKDGSFYYLSYDAFPSAAQELDDQCLVTGESGKNFYQDAWILASWSKGFKVAIAKPSGFIHKKNIRVSNYVTLDAPKIDRTTVQIIFSPIIVNPDNDTLDDDNDGVPLTKENKFGTDPDDIDTDDDTLNDSNDIYGVEMTIILDGQQPTNINTAATDPLNPDTDGDGVLDGDEVYGWSVSNWITDPCNPDTDGDWVVDGNDPNPLGISDINGDGIADEWVIYWTNQVTIWGFNDLMIEDLLDGGGDADGDGILNSNEYANGSIPIVPNGYYETRIILSPIVITA